MNTSDLAMASSADEEHQNEDLDQLFAAIRNGDKAHVESVMRDQPDLITEVHIEIEEATPLMHSAACNQLEILELILTRNQDVNDTNQFGWAPLHFATKNANREMCEILIKHGASVTAQSALGGTPIEIAVEHGHIEILKFLIQNGADPHLGTLVIHSVVNSQFEMFEYLINIGCDVNKISESMYPIHVAAAKGQFQFVEVLLERGARVDVTDAHGTTPLIIATRAGYTDIVEALLKHGADVHISDQSYSTMTAVHYASYLGMSDCLHLLLRHGADPNVPDRSGFTSIMRAISSSCDSIIVILVKENVDLNTFGSPISFNDRLCAPISPLELTLQTKQYNLAKLLLQCDVRAASLRRSKSILTRNQNPSKFEKEIQVAIEQRMLYPLMLKEISRHCIRRFLGSPVCERISHLPIPLLLKKFLQYSDECKQYCEAGTQKRVRNALAHWMPSHWINHDDNLYDSS